MDLNDLVTELAVEYVRRADEPGTTTALLVRIAEDHRPGPLAMLMMQLSLASDGLVDDLLCTVDRFREPDLDGHMWCCDGECGCRGKGYCERCEEVLVDRYEIAVRDLLALIHPRILDYIKHVSERAVA